MSSHACDYFSLGFVPKSVPNVASPCYHWVGPGGQQTARGAVFGVGR